MVRQVRVEARDPDDGQFLGALSSPFTSWDFAMGRPSKMARRFVAAMRRSPFNGRPDGRICRRAQVLVRIDEPSVDPRAGVQEDDNG